MIPWQLITTLPVLSLWKLVRNSTSLSLFLTRISWIGGVLLGFATNTCGKNNITTEIYGIEKILLSHLIQRKTQSPKAKKTETNNEKKNPKQNRKSWLYSLMVDALGSMEKFVFLTLSTLTSVYIFSILLSVHLLRCWQGEFI